jgi:N-carbamoylputrescine amidase
MPARAYDNTVFVVGVNPVGDNGAGLTFAGAALIAGPKGQILAEAQSDRETVITAQLSADDLRAIKEGPMGYFLPQRRPKLYDLS